MPRRCKISLISRLFTENIVFPFLDHLKDPVVILKRDGRIVEANDAFLSLIGKKKSDVIGKKYEDFKILKILENSLTLCYAKNKEQTENISYEDKILSATLMPVMLDDEIVRVSIVFRDISNFMKIEKELLKRNKELMVINTLSNAFISAENIDLVYTDILEKVLIISNLSVGWLTLIEQGDYSLKSTHGVSLDFRGKLREGSLNFLYDKGLNSSGPIFVLESNELPDELKKEGIMFYVAIPLRVGRESMGILSLASRSEITFDFDLASLFSLIGNSLSLIAEKIKLFQETQRLAITDGLTGLYNARYFYGVLDVEIARTKRYSTPFSIVLFDIDNFKRLNDTYGHQAGDDVLRMIADVLRVESRKSDIMARYGGEEFIAILPNTPKIEAFGIANRIREAVSNKVFLSDPSINVTISGGVASCPEDAQDTKTLLYCADMAMYEAKAAGKNRVVIYRRRT